MAFHAAFILSLLSLPRAEILGVFRHLFASWETLAAVALWYATYHVAIWWHERGHYWQSVASRTLREDLLPDAEGAARAGGFGRLAHEARMFALAPLGRFPGIRRQGLGYYVEAPFNLSAAAKGPEASGRLGLLLLPLAGLLVAAGFVWDAGWTVFIGRLFFGIGAVALLDRLLADPGRYGEFQRQERRARSAASTVRRTGRWHESVAAVARTLRTTRLAERRFSDGVVVRAPWAFRNSGMGGRHTERDYPESNISLQESMFIPLSARSYEDSQEMTVALQGRLKQVIDAATGCRVMGIGMEGGLAAYVTPEPGDEVPELRLWRMMRQAIEDNGYTPGADVAIAVDAAASELQAAYRQVYDQPDAVGTYLFWRDQNQQMSRDQLLALYEKAIYEEDVPIVSFEDPFGEDDWEGWQAMMARLGDRVLIVGDDLVTTKDSTIESASARGAANAVLVKANQIGTLTETTAAMVVAMAKGMDLVVSHRSQSPNETMEAEIAMAAGSLGLKAGGGANTERLVKYAAVADVLSGPDEPAAMQTPLDGVPTALESAVITDITAREEYTNAGMPTVRSTVVARVPGDRRKLVFTGATPLGTSAGSDEARHLVDSVITHGPVVERHPGMFALQSDGTYRFAESLSGEHIEVTGDEDLKEIWRRARRFDGRGVLNAVRNVQEVLGPAFLGRRASDLGGLAEIDRTLLAIELTTARERGRDCGDPVAVVQLKACMGMNAVLSLSLALARFKAFSEGKDLWRLLQEQLVETLSGVGDGQRNGVAPSFDRLIEEAVAANRKAEQEGRPFYEAVRSQLAIYELEAGSSRVRASLGRALGGTLSGRASSTRQ